MFAVCLPYVCFILNSRDKREGRVEIGYRIGRRGEGLGDEREGRGQGRGEVRGKMVPNRANKLGDLVVRSTYFGLIIGLLSVLHDLKLLIKA